MLLEYSGVQIGYQKVLQILSVHHLVHFALILYFTVRYATSVISGGGAKGDSPIYCSLENASFPHLIFSLIQDRSNAVGL